MEILFNLQISKQLCVVADSFSFKQLTRFIVLAEIHVRACSEVWNTTYSFGFDFQVVVSVSYD